MRPGGLNRLGCAFQSLARTCRKGVPGFGESYPPLISPKKPGAQFVFQIHDLVTKRRMADAQALRKESSSATAAKCRRSSEVHPEINLEVAGEEKARAALLLSRLRISEVRDFL